MTLITGSPTSARRPAPASADRRASTIDGRPSTVPEGTSVMRAAALAGIDIPKLCATDSLEAFGSCRLCLVEIDGRQGHAGVVHHAGARRAWCVSTQTPQARASCAAA